MRRAIIPCGAIGAALLTLFLEGCPTQASYPSTITPVYAATNSGLYASSNGGASWTHYSVATTSGFPSDTVTSVVVSGSGSGAEVFAGTTAGIARSVGSGWTTLSTTSSPGLGSNQINGLFLGSNLYAATAGGVSMYDTDTAGQAWTNDNSVLSVNAVYPFGSYTYVAAASGLHVYNGRGSESTFTPAQIVAGSATVNAVIVDGYQDIIAATDLGLNILNSGATAFRPAPLLGPTVTNGVSGSVQGLYIDGYGALYAASDTGLYIFSPSGGTLSLGGLPVYCVYVDGAGTIYAGTDSGLEISKDGGPTWSYILGSASSPIRVNAIVTTAPLYSF